MNTRSPAVASTAIAIMLLGACSDDDSSTTTSDSSTTTTEAPDDGPTTVADGDVVLVATSDHDARPLTISAVEEAGEVTGEFQMSGHTIRIECADTDTDGIGIVGGTVTAGDAVPPGELLGLIIKEGDPDSAHLRGNDFDAGSCTEFLESIPEDLLTDDSQFIEVEDGDDIRTG